MVTAEQISKLSNREKIAAMQLLGEDFSRQGLESNVPSRHKELLDAREKSIKYGYVNFIPWEEAKRQIDDQCR